MSRDYFIDYIKGIAILFVIIFHSGIERSLKIETLLTTEQSVPLFLLASSFIYFKKNKNLNFYKKNDFIKFFKRIFFPFIIFELLILFVSYCKGEINLKSFILKGGFGPGSYYPYLYLQYWLLLPIFNYLIKCKNLKLIHAIIISVLFELFFSIISLNSIFSIYSDPIWRLFVGRSVFIIYLGFLISENKFKVINFLPLIFIGIFVSILQRYSIYNFSIFFFTSKAFVFNGIHWPLYFYSAFFFIFLRNLYFIFSSKIKILLCWLGFNSWEIFLSQMLFFEKINLDNFYWLPHYLKIPFFICFSMFSCIFIAFIFINLKNIFLKMLKI